MKNNYKVLLSFVALAALTGCTIKTGKKTSSLKTDTEQKTDDESSSGGSTQQGGTDQGGNTDQGGGSTQGGGSQDQGGGSQDQGGGSQDQGGGTTTDKDKYTVMLYLCGADLESSTGYRNMSFRPGPGGGGGGGESVQGLATKSLTNILSVSGKPDNVNFIVETGGASKWASTYGISNSKLQRWHVEDQQLVKDADVSGTNNMGLASTFQSFIEWGLKEYPAEKTAVILSDHGGAMWGTCFDENNPIRTYDFDWDDGLTNDEIATALKNAFASTGRTEKLEWIGYDACLMQVQDIAELNSKYFNYMIASEETEMGDGWAYGSWLSTLYSLKDTPTILSKICSTFVSAGSSGGYYDQTLSYLDLNQIDAYKTAWENMANQLRNKVTSSNKSSFASLVKSCKYYGDSDSSYYCIYDALDFVNKLSSNSTFNPGTTYTTAVKNAHANLVKGNVIGKSAGNSNGLCMFYSTSSDSYQDDYYTAANTNFANWRYLSNTFGS